MRKKAPSAHQNDVKVIRRVGLSAAGPIEEDHAFVRRLLPHRVFQRQVLERDPRDHRLTPVPEKPCPLRTAGHQRLAPRGAAPRKNLRRVLKSLSYGLSGSDCAAQPHGSPCAHDPERSQSACGKTAPGRASRAGSSSGLPGKEAAWSRIICHCSEECQSGSSAQVDMPSESYWRASSRFIVSSAAAINPAFQ